MHPDIAAEVPALRVLLSEARRIGDSRTAASCLERLSWLSWVLLDGDLADECSREAAELHVPDRSSEAFRLAVRRASDKLQRGDAKEALQQLDAAEREGERLDIDAFVSYLSVRSDVLSAVGENESAIECARLACSIARKRPNVEALFLTMLYLGYAYQAGGVLSESLKTFDEAAAIADSAALGWQSALARARGAFIALLRGDCVGARARLLTSLESNERVPWLEVTRTYAGLTIGLACGDDALIETFADPTTIERALGSRDTYSIGRTLCAFYEYYKLRDDRARMSSLATIALERCRSADTIWPMFTPIARFGEPEHVERASQLIDAFPEAHPVAAAQRRLFDAILAERVGNLRNAAQLAGEAFLLFENYHCRYQASVALAVAGRTTEARARFKEDGLAGLASQLTSATRGRPRLSYESAQTRREIFPLILAGKSSKEIARQLGLSERTIKSRISEIFARTGTHKRAELHAEMTSLL